MHFLSDYTTSHRVNFCLNYKVTLLCKKDGEYPTYILRLQTEIEITQKYISVISVFNLMKKNSMHKILNLLLMEICKIIFRITKLRSVNYIFKKV